MRQRAVHRKEPPSIGMRQRAVHQKNHSPLVCDNGAVHRKKPFSIGMRQRRGASQKTILHWYATTARCIAKTAEVRFHMLARGWLAYPVAPAAHATTAEVRL